MTVASSGWRGLVLARYAARYGEGEQARGQGSKGGSGERRFSLWSLRWRHPTPLARCLTHSSIRLSVSRAPFLSTNTLPRLTQRTHTHTHTRARTHTHTRARARTHTHTRWFLWFTGTFHRRNGFYTVKLYVLLTYTYPTPKLSPHRRRAFIFPSKKLTLYDYKRFKYGGHWNVLIPSPSPCNTCHTHVIHTNLCPHKTT